MGLRLAAAPLLAAPPVLALGRWQMADRRALPLAAERPRAALPVLVVMNPMRAALPVSLAGALRVAGCLVVGLVYLTLI